MFELSLLNPLRLIDTSDINFSFDGNFAIDRLQSYQNPKCYYQKWQKSDTLKLQILSEFVPTDLLFKDVFTGWVVGSAAFADQEIIISGYPDLKVFELEYLFTGLPEGKYYAEFSYIDEDDQEHTLISEPICVSEVQDNTLLIKYTHTENDFSVIFDTEIIFQFRVEAAIKNFNPKNSRAVYTDQKYNSTQLSATPYRTFKLFIGFQYGVPEWVFDKINWIQSVDQVSYNNVFYQILNEAEYEVQANDDNSLMGGSIDVQPVDNNFTKYKIDTSDSGNTFTPMQKVIPYYNVAGNFPIAGFFKKFSTLEKICIEKRSAAEIELVVGTTPGGSEIGSFTVDDPAFTQTIEWMFNGTTTVYLSGLAGADCDIFMIYKQLDEPPVNIGDGSGVIPPVVGNGAVWIYEEVQPGDLNLDFNTVTGLGRANTNWAGWVMCDGRNGTEDRGGVIPIGQKLDDPDFANLGQRGGAKTRSLTLNNIPSHGKHFENAVSGKRPGFGNGENVVWPKDEVYRGSDPVQAFSIMNPYLVTLYVKKIS